jgi:hypothetical protein
MEPNSAVLIFEVGIAVYSAFYLGYLLQKNFRQMVKKQ